MCCETIESDSRRGCQNPPDQTEHCHDTHGHNAHDVHEHPSHTSCDGHDHNHASHAHSHTDDNHCCCHDHKPMEAVDQSLLQKASATTAIYRIVNMDCPMEEALIRKKLATVPGITSLEFNLMQRVLTVHHLPGDTLPIENALRAIDMNPEPLTGQTAKSNEIPQAVIPWKKLIGSTIIAAFSEIFDLMAEWQAQPFGLNLPAVTIGSFPVMEVLSLLLAVAAIVLAGLGTYRKGWLAISNINLNINALMAVAVTGAVLIGQFPEAAMVMVLFNISEAIEAKALDRARNAIRDLLNLVPALATVQQQDGSWKEQEVSAIAVGAIVRVRPGEKIALDGEVTAGTSAVNQAPITGESMPVEKKSGDPVYGGTINETGSLEFRVTAAANDTTLARIIHAVEEAQGKRAPMQRFVDVFAKYYTPCVFILAILWAILPPLAFGADWYESIYTALVILVIGCPCALVISTPVTVVSGMAAATRKGILIKGGLYLELGRRMNWLALDKTGTITWGKPVLTDFVNLNLLPDAKAMQLAISLASRSDHPVSLAIARSDQATGIEALQVEDFAAIPGQGTAGKIDGTLWHLGNQGMLKALGRFSPELEDRLTALEKQGKTAVTLANAENAVAIFAVADTVKDSSIEAINELHKLNVKTMMLTGDNAYTARAIASEVGVDEVRASLLPQEKLAIIENLEKEGNITGMVGDGINDAPALAKANIGFAMAKEGTDTAIETADIALMDDDLRKIPRFIRLSRAAYSILVENIALALGIKAVFFALTLTGNATMWMAVFADVGAALLVVANGLRTMGK